MASSDRQQNLVDTFGRRIDYVRLSVTDRCNLRCRYCMAEDMTFLPRRDLLTLEELAELGEHLVRRGVTRIRITGGEPLVRRGILGLFRDLGSMIGRGLDEVTVTTNGTELPKMAAELHSAGVRRINVSLDTLDAEKFAHITRRGNLSQVLKGIDAARTAGLKIKLNMVAMKGVNDDEFAEMAAWCAANGLDLSIIETMPLGEVEGDRSDTYLPVAAARDAIEERFDLVPSLHRTGGPSRYFELSDTGSRVGFISPLSNNFCAGCNRIRIAATGTIYGCLGHDQKVELRDIMREGGTVALDEALDRLIAGKPERHDFDINRVQPAVARHMSVTGG
ncbi:GTP 3',8-cyclase MoaA [Erythrobacter litoralis]|uniref:GTP 3',8-cyclase MoaA n=1 Tax=Erythrobacter litoralis TaxID=39960 RepID=UPI0024357463|nr:GTP 3',8-cyclase MoaA [Erythrobacter litoralis]MDG6080244.1 GTP 3',8-cyclase MoaA [Erythrobacter litoralis]